MNKKFLNTAKIGIPALLLFLLSSCLKTHSGFTDFTQTQEFVILTGAGTGNFKASNIQANPSDTATITKTITADLASNNDNSGTLTITVGVDNSIIDAYNTANGTSFQPFPDSTFKIVSNQITIPAGQHYGTTSVQIFQSKLDPTVSYMLPISITDAGGKQISSNQNTIYYNVIGNPIAGNYNQEWLRWNGLTGAPPDPATTPPTFDVPLAATFAPISPTTISVASNTGVAYLVSFTNTAGVLSNFTVAFPTDPNDPGSAAANGITITAGPNIITADPTTKTYDFWFNYNNSAGKARVIEDKFTP